MYEVHTVSNLPGVGFLPLPRRRLFDSLEEALDWCRQIAAREQAYRIPAHDRAVYHRGYPVRWLLSGVEVEAVPWPAGV